MLNAYISGTGSYVPPRVVTNDDLARDFGIDTTHEWVVQRTGIEARRFAEEGVGSSDLAVHAAEEAIARAGIQKHDLDLILFSTLSPEHHFPGSGVYLQRKLGLLEGDSPKFVPAMDIRNQCSGFLYGLGTATAMVRSGAARHVLVVGAETHSAALDLSTRGRQVASLFGDGAGAVIVSATEEDRGVRTWHLGADGRFADTLCLKVWDIRKRPYIPVGEDGMGRVDPAMLWPYMEGKVVFRHAVERMCGALMQACWALNVDANDIDLFFFHQANKRINEYVASTLNIPPHKVLSNIERYGNTTAATIPLLLAEAEREGTLRKGMKVALVAFGSGFTWGSAIVDW
ncbi:3-oxoacyl-ACP synthase III family protein [Chondromyces crocatus]|uniref:3-oxoacyl-ACP synthase n=1 Tax=Chondromyces crocatus TaxID=52 RepID=A0A0K1E776_CHOCO|nr:beta-ketoacyl-ACP synthase III [Chondromyces crocatus]AKT36704.1 3-oxoacyl-ACP synthase [Chondromyces crocatus]